MKPEVLGFEQNAIDTDVISFHFKPSGCRNKLSYLESNYRQTGVKTIQIHRVCSYRHHNKSYLPMKRRGRSWTKIS